MRIISGRFKGMALATPREGTRPTTDRTKEAIFSHLGAWGVLEDARVLDLFAGTGALGLEALSRGARELVAVESSRPAAALIAKTLTSLQRNKAWTSELRARVVTRKAEQFVAAHGHANRDGASSDAGHDRNAEGANREGRRGNSSDAGHDGNAERALHAQRGLGGGTGTGAGTHGVFDVVFIDPPYAYSTEDCVALLASLTSGGLVSSDGVIVLERSARSDEPAAPEGWQITQRRDYGETAVFYLERAA